MFLKRKVMESISIDDLDSGSVKGNYVELSPLFFEGPSLKPNQHFIEAKIVSGDHEESARTVIQERLRMKMIIKKTVI